MRYPLIALSVVCLGLSALLTGCSGSAPAPAAKADAPPPAAAAPPSTPPSTAPAEPPVVADGPAPRSPPETLEFVSKRDGNVTFTHLKHIERVNGDCSTCHPKIFPQSRDPIDYGKAVHRAAEAKRNACAACHAIGGTAFAADSNCPKCHQVRRPRG